MKRVLLSFLSIVFAFSLAYSQEGEAQDSLIRLMSAKKARLIDANGKPYRKIEGPARFLHNNTYLICDNALWNVDEEVIDAVGNVQIIQNNTILTGDSLHYIISEDLAQFRGSLVELKDKENNILRTNNIDYNTRDSIGYFSLGASMMDKDGNVFESDEGTYESKLNLFTFVGNVQMFSDSLFFIADKVKYYSDFEKAYFFGNTKGWQDENYMESNSGWYSKRDETCYFETNVYGQTKDYEIWCGDLLYDRVSDNALLHNNIQLLDTLDGVIVMGNELLYNGSPRSVRVTKEPVFAALTEEAGVKDTAYIVADTLKYKVLKRFEVDSASVVAAKERKGLAEIDAVENYKAQNRKAEAVQDDKSQEGVSKSKSKDKDKDEKQKQAETLQIDSLAADSAIIDSLAVVDSTVVDSSAVVDSIVVAPLDTTEIAFIEAYHNVKIFKSDMQALCDSLLYSDLDSMARLFKEPIIWNEGDKQFVADSIQVVVKNKSMEKGILLSNAFLIMRNTDELYNQVKSPEMVGHFKDGELSRFDAMGGASMIFYLQEDTLFTNMNQKECKIISSLLKNGNLQKTYYFGTVKSDLHPVWELKPEQKRLKDFNWRGEEMPKTRFDITKIGVRESIREDKIESPMFPQFPHTERYFSGYIDKIMEEIYIRKPLKWRYRK